MSLRYKNLVIVPTYHSNLDFVHEVRKAFYAQIPDIIAVELPENLASLITQGVNRLPKISIITYYDELLKQVLFVPIDPSDSMIEALQLGLEYGIESVYIDLFVKNYTPTMFARPDSYVLNELSLEDFYELFRKTWQLDIAANDKNMKKHDSVKPTADSHELEGDTTLTGSEAQAWLKNPDEIDRLRDHYMAAKLQELIDTGKTVLVVIGLSHWESIKKLLETREIDDDLTAFMTSATKAEIYNVEREDLPKVMLETPNIVYQWLQFRTKQKNFIDDPEFSWNDHDLGKFPHFSAIKKIIERSVKRFKKEYNETINLHKLKSLFQYMRNLPLIDNMIKPQLFEIVLAAKGIMNDEFAWIVWDECKKYPYARVDPKMESAIFAPGGIYLHGKFFRLRRHIPLVLKKVKLPLKPRPQEKKPGEWQKIWDRNGWNLVSHIPEDIFEENYFQHVRRRAINLMKDKYIRIHEFISTLLDGIDFRETLRNWAFKQKIYVREERPIQGDIDSVVIIFDRDEHPRQQERYPNTMMWYAEHNHESDLALYSTIPGRFLVGPGITRVELGGVVSFFPPRMVPDVWNPLFARRFPQFFKKADRILAAGIAYAQKKFVVCVSKERPRSIFYTFAQKYNVSLIHIPLERFNPISIRALRNLHMLAGKQVRKFANKFVQKRRY